MKLRTAIAISAAAALAMPSQAQFVNGSFEDPAITPASAEFVTTDTLPGWTLSGASFLVSNGYDGSGVMWNPTPAGSQYLYINPNVAAGQTISQSLNLTAGSDAVTFLQADFATGFEVPGGDLRVSVVRTSDSSVIASQEFTVPAFSGFVSQSLSYDAPTDGAYTFIFSSLPGNKSAIVDNIALASAVPEPSALALFGLGAAGICLRRRKLS